MNDYDDYDAQAGDSLTDLGFFAVALLFMGALFVFGWVLVP